MIMKKKNETKDTNVVDFGDQQVKIKVDDVKTDKKLLKAAEKVVRRLDRIVTDLSALSYDALRLRNWDESEYNQCSEKDQARLEEMAGIIDSSTKILFCVADRMARKYIGKQIEGLSYERKSLKKAG